MGYLFGMLPDRGICVACFLHWVYISQDSEIYVETDKLPTGLIPFIQSHVYKYLYYVGRKYWFKS